MRGRASARVQSTMPSGYDEYLAALHAKNQLANEILDDALREVSSERVLSKRRIVAGEANEVSDSTAMIVASAAHARRRASPLAFSNSGATGVQG